MRNVQDCKEDVFGEIGIYMQFVEDWEGFSLNAAVVMMAFKYLYFDMFIPERALQSSDSSVSCNSSHPNAFYQSSASLSCQFIHSVEVPLNSSPTSWLIICFLCLVTSRDSLSLPAL